MDVETRRAFWADMRAFAAEGRTILFATHYLEEADQVADRIVVLDHGRIVADGTAAAIKSTAHRRTIRFRLAGADRTVLAALPGAETVDVAADGWSSNRAIRTRPLAPCCGPTSTSTTSRSAGPTSKPRSSP
jgi:ABC-2 type transport system ATP-binding protein